MSAVARVWLAPVIVGLALAAFSTTALAQESKSAALAKELSAALDAAKLDSIATKDPAKPDVFFGALYFPGTQLLVVSAQYTAPLHMNETIGKKDYREAYLDLSSASDSALVSQSMKPLMTSRNRPSVRITIGNARILATGRMNAFTTPNTSATPRKAVQPPV